MKIINRLKLVLIAAAGFILGILLFFPWQSIGDYVMSRGLAIAAENGIYASVDGCGAEGLIDKEIVYQRVTADFPVFRFSVGEIRLNPAFISSLFSRKLSCTVKLGRGEIMPVTRQKLEWTSASASIFIEKELVSVRDIEFLGKFSARGFLEISRETGRISRANMILHIPEDMDRAFEMLSRSGMAPLTKIKTGEWKVER